MFLYTFSFGLYLNIIQLKMFEWRTVHFIFQYRPSSKINNVQVFENIQALGSLLVILCEAKNHQKQKYLIF